MSANDPKRTFAGVVIPVLSQSPARRLELPFERRNPVAQLDRFELRVHSGGEAGKTGKHRTFVCVEIGAYGMRTIERQGKAADRICCRHRENWPPETWREIDPIVILFLEPERLASGYGREHGLLKIEFAGGAAFPALAVFIPH